MHASKPQPMATHVGHTTAYIIIWGVQTVSKEVWPGAIHQDSAGSKEARPIGSLCNRVMQHKAGSSYRQTRRSVGWMPLLSACSILMHMPPPRRLVLHVVRQLASKVYMDAQEKCVSFENTG